MGPRSLGASLDKNLILAIGLSLLVYVGWFGFVEKRIAPKHAPQSAASAIAQNKDPKDAAVKPASGGSPTSRPASEDPLPAGEPAAASTNRQQLEREAYLVKLGKANARVHPRGAALVSLQYREPLGTVELVRDAVPGLFASFSELRFAQSKDSPTRFEAARADGLKVVKEFVPPASDDALPTLRLTLANNGKKPVETGDWAIVIGPGLGTILSEESENAKLTRVIAFVPGSKGLNGKIEALKAGEHLGDYRWVAIDNRYFLAALLPKPGEFKIVSSDPATLSLRAASQTLAPASVKTYEVPYYVGEKGHVWLSRYGQALERSIDFGFFAQLGRYILKSLDKLHGLTGNWGWAIVLLTVILQVLLFPLTYKSLKAQAAMKKLQPEIARLQQRYAKEPQKLNAEMMEMYKKHGANPLGGCLPMLLQMPVFLALFNTLRNAWELHGAGWMLWVKDLSAKDPYYVLPLSMGALMFFQNKLNPPSSDPTQAQMMTWMPIIFTFMFLNFPSGLVLYWLTNSVVNFVAQVALKDHFEKA